MKHSNTILHIVFGFAIVVLFILVAKNNQSNSKQQSSEPLQIAVKDSSGNIVIKPFPVAYIIVDSLMRNYLYYKKIEGQYQTLVKQEDSSFNNKDKHLNKKCINCKCKYKRTDNKSRCTNERTRITNASTKLMEWQQSKQQELANKEQLLMKELLIVFKLPYNFIMQIINTK